MTGGDVIARSETTRQSAARVIAGDRRERGNPIQRRCTLGLLRHNVPRNDRGRIHAMTGFFKIA